MKSQEIPLGAGKCRGHFWMAQRKHGVRLFNQHVVHCYLTEGLIPQCLWPFWGEDHRFYLGPCSQKSDQSGE